MFFAVTGHIFSMEWFIGLETQGDLDRNAISLHPNV